MDVIRDRQQHGNPLLEEKKVNITLHFLDIYSAMVRYQKLEI